MARTRTHESKAERLELRLSKDDKQIMERAAAVSGSTLTDYVRSIMVSASVDRVREHEIIRLSNQGADAFVEAVTNPKEPGEGLKSLNKKARRIPGGA
jgi:uncharacterized protein (DUF1778 family)